MANEKSSNESGGGLRTVTLTNVQWEQAVHLSAHHNELPQRADQRMGRTGAQNESRRFPGIPERRRQRRVFPRIGT